MSPTELHRRALDDVTGLVDRIRPADLDRATPCAGWDLAALLAHMIGQNHGFADAVGAGNGGIAVAAFAPRPAGPDPAGPWRASADRVAAALARAPAGVPVRLPEIDPDRWFPPEAVAGIHLLDTVVHAGDVGSALGRAYRPDDELLEAVLRRAEQVPDGPARSAPGAAFGPAAPGAGSTDAWVRVLALLGRA